MFNRIRCWFRSALQKLLGIASCGHVFGYGILMAMNWENEAYRVAIGLILISILVRFVAPKA